LAPNDPKLATSNNNVGGAYQGRGEYWEAISYFDKALAIWIKTLKVNDPKIATVYNNLGWAYSSIADYKTAAAYYEKALAIDLKALGKNHPAIAINYNNLGGLYKEKGDFDQAISYYEKSLAILLKSVSVDHPNVAILYSNLGTAYVNKGAYIQAITYYEKALAIRLKAFGADNPDVAISYNNLGQVYLNEKNYDQALSFYEKALAIWMKSYGAESETVTTAYNNLGVVYDYQKDFKQAITFYEKALAIDLKILDLNHPEIASLYNNIGEIYRESDDYDQAISYYNKALAIILKTFGPENSNTALSYNNLGETYRAQGDYDQAISYYEKAWAVINKTASHQDAVTISLNSGRLYLERNQYPQAQNSFQRGIESIEKARLEMGAGKNEFMGRNLELYQYALKTRLLMDDPAGAFMMAETMKERGFLDQLSLNSALHSEGISSQDRDRAMKLAQDIESTTLMLQAELKKPETTQNKTALVTLSGNLESKEKEFTALDEKLLRNDKYRSLRHQTIPALENAQRLCDENTAILEYVIWEGPSKDRQSYCLVVTKNDLQIIELSRDFEYSKAVARLRQAIRVNNETLTNETSTVLWANLIKPLQKSLTGINRLIVVPDGVLGFLPFDALREKASGRYLGQEYLISLSPSISVMSLLKQRNNNPKRNQFLAFGGADYSKNLAAKRGQAEETAESDVSETLASYYAQRSGLEGMANYYQLKGITWPNLPGTLDEVKTLKSMLFKQKENKIFTGRDASEAKVKELSNNRTLSKYRIIHFACHGYYDPDYPSLSSVILTEVSGAFKSAEDGYLSVEEAALLNLNADFVNLSACETGLGKNEQGNGVIGLTRAFEVAGANMVGVTLWTVDDEATKQFMISVYKKVYQQNKSYIEAYAETKQEFIHSEKYSSPYYWCPFVLYGQ
jgi:CHAT domain-containing protein/tetratricopeptide (TPR) repeat protein